MPGPIGPIVDANQVPMGTSTNPLYTAASGAGSGSVRVLNVSAVGYETVAASQTAQVLGGSGATGDFLVGLLIVPATTSPGSVTLLDNATSISVFVSSTLSTTIPFFVPKIGRAHV